MKSRLSRTAAGAAIAAGAFLVIFLASSQSWALKLGQDHAPVKLAPGNPALALQNAFIEVAAAVSPAVVKISAEWTVNYPGFGDMDEIMRYFFYGPGGGRRGPPMRQRKESDLGSGFLVSADGYIITNAHVIGKAEKVTVTLQDGTTYHAKIVGKDERTDVGVLKISEGKKTFPYVSLGNSDDINVGQWSIAIGNPFGFEHTVTTGVISAKGRSNPQLSEKSAVGYIQTDASINPGNSGGPLCNIQGEVIGINAAIFSQTGGNIGIGFAIPINLAKKIAEDLVNKGKVIRAGMGAMVSDLSPKMAKSFGLKNTEGALIQGVNPGSAAEKAGVQAGDIVLALEGTQINNAGDLISKLYTYQPGQAVQLTILRKGNTIRIPVTLQTLKDKDSIKGSSGEEREEGGQGESQGLGLAYQDQTADLRQQLPEGAPKGPVITQVAPQSPADQAGLQPGDIVLKVGNTTIYSANQLKTILKKSDLKEGVRLFVWREGETLYAILQTED